MTAQETNNASEETLHTPTAQGANAGEGGAQVKSYDAEVDAGMSPLRASLVARDSNHSEASSARTIRDDTTGLDKEKGGNGQQGQESGDGKRHHRPGLLERTTSGHARGQKREDGKVELKEKDVYGELGFSYSRNKKWTILSVSSPSLMARSPLSILISPLLNDTQIIFLVQLSMNMNAGIYGSALEQFQEHFHVSAQVGRLGQGLFLISYAFGCELWAPFSEE